MFSSDKFKTDSENTLTHIWKETLNKVFFFCSIAYCHHNHVDDKDKLKIRFLSSSWNLVTCLSSVCCYANETLQSVNTAFGHFDSCVCWIIVSYPEASLSQTGQGQERSRRIWSGWSNGWSPTTNRNCQNETEVFCRLTRLKSWCVLLEL